MRKKKEISLTVNPPPTHHAPIWKWAAPLCLHDVLVHLSCCNKNATAGMAYPQQKLTCHSPEAGSPWSEPQPSHVPARALFPAPSWLLPSHCALTRWKEQASSGPLLQGRWSHSDSSSCHHHVCSHGLLQVQSAWEMDSSDAPGRGGQWRWSEGHMASLLPHLLNLKTKLIRTPRSRFLLPHFSACTPMALWHTAH